MTPGSDFYSTSAQVIPTLLLVLAVESHALDRLQWRVLQIVFAAAALLGEVAAVRALYVGGSDVRAFVVFLGVMASILLVLQPLTLLLIMKDRQAPPLKIVLASLLGLAALMVGLAL